MGDGRWAMGDNSKVGVGRSMAILISPRFVSFVSREYCMRVMVIRVYTQYDTGCRSVHLHLQLHLRLHLMCMTVCGYALAPNPYGLWVNIQPTGE